MTLYSADIETLRRYLAEDSTSELHRVSNADIQNLLATFSTLAEFDGAKLSELSLTESEVTALSNFFDLVNAPPAIRRTLVVPNS